MHQFLSRVTGLVLFACALARCRAEGLGEPPSLLVSTQWVDEHRVGLKLVDVRDLGPYDRGHLPGAIHVKWRTFSDPEAKHPGSLHPEPAKLGQMLGAMGISSSAPVVIYSDPRRTWGEEGRMFWMLEYLGHKQVAIMDGGWPKWIAEQRAVETFRVPNITVRFTPELREDRRIGWQELQRRLGDPALGIVDTRTAAEFNGATPYGEARGGHVPGATHLPWESLLDERGLLRPRPQLEHVLASRGIVPGKDTVSYCTGGIRSGFVYFVTRLLGYPRTRNYDGSMWEWADHPDLPLEK